MPTDYDRKTQTEKIMMFLTEVNNTSKYNMQYIAKSFETLDKLENLFREKLVINDDIANHIIQYLNMFPPIKQIIKKQARTHFTNSFLLSHIMSSAKHELNIAIEKAFNSRNKDTTDLRDIVNYINEANEIYRSASQREIRIYYDYISGKSDMFSFQYINPEKPHNATLLLYLSQLPSGMDIGIGISLDDKNISSPLPYLDLSFFVRQYSIDSLYFVVKNSRDLYKIFLEHLELCYESANKFQNCVDNIKSLILPYF